MLKIGDFSKLSQISIKALHLYDRLDLLKPTWVDPDTGYRYYSASQLPRINRILAFKDLGFSLAQIRQLLDDRISIEQMRGMLRLRQVELQQQIESEQWRLVRVEAQIAQIEGESTMSDLQIVIKKIEPIRVVSIRQILPGYQAVGSLFNELIAYLHQHGIFQFEYCAAIWHDPEYRESDVDSEAAIGVDRELPATDRIYVYELPACAETACIIHHGSYRTIESSYRQLLKWIETNRYEIIAPNREFYISHGEGQNDESSITEIQFPVRKLG